MRHLSFSVFAFGLALGWPLCLRAGSSEADPCVRDAIAHSPVVDPATIELEKDAHLWWQLARPWSKYDNTPIPWFSWTEAERADFYEAFRPTLAWIRAAKGEAFLIRAHLAFLQAEAAMVSRALERCEKSGADCDKTRTLRLLEMALWHVESAASADLSLFCLETSQKADLGRIFDPLVRKWLEWSGVNFTNVDNPFTAHLPAKFRTQAIQLLPEGSHPYNVTLRDSQKGKRTNQKATLLISFSSEILGYMGNTKLQGQAVVPIFLRNMLAFALPDDRMRQSTAVLGLERRATQGQSALLAAQVYLDSPRGNFSLPLATAFTGLAITLADINALSEEKASSALALQKQLDEKLPALATVLRLQIGLLTDRAKQLRILLNHSLLAGMPSERSPLLFFVKDFYAGVRLFGTRQDTFGMALVNSATPPSLVSLFYGLFSEETPKSLFTSPLADDTFSEPIVGFGRELRELRARRFSENFASADVGESLNVKAARAMLSLYSRLLDSSLLLSNRLRELESLKIQVDAYLLTPTADGYVALLASCERANATNLERVSLRGLELPELSHNLANAPMLKGGPKGIAYRPLADVRGLFLAEGTNTALEKIGMDAVISDALKRKIFFHPVPRSNVGYDVLVGEKAEYFVEVKALKEGSESVALSPNEYDFALKHQDNWVLALILVKNDGTATLHYRHKLPLTPMSELDHSRPLRVDKLLAQPAYEFPEAPQNL